MKDDNIEKIATASVLQARMQTRRRFCLPEDEGIDDRKNLCAKVQPPLADEVRDMCRFLGVSKRLFIEQSIVDALNRASAVIWQHCDEDQDHPGVVPDFVYKRMKRTPQRIEDLVSDPSARPGFQGLAEVEEVQS